MPLAALCEKAFSDSKNDAHWPWDLLSDEAMICLMQHAAEPDISTGAMTTLFYVGACAPAADVSICPRPSREEYVHIRSIDGSIELGRAVLHLMGGDSQGHDDAVVGGIVYNDLYDAVFDSLQDRRCNLILDSYGRAVYSAGLDAGIALRGVVVRALNEKKHHLVIAELLAWAIHNLGPRYAIYEVWQRVEFRYTCDCYGIDPLGDSGGSALRSSTGFSSVLRSNGLIGSVSNISQALVSYYRLLNAIWLGRSVDEWMLLGRPLLEYYSWCVADGSDAVAYGRLADLTVGRMIIDRSTVSFPVGRTSCQRCS